VVPENNNIAKGKDLSKEGMVFKERSLEEEEDMYSNRGSHGLLSGSALKKQDRVNRKKGRDIPQPTSCCCFSFGGSRKRPKKSKKTNQNSEMDMNSS
jgi:hypothetical protein